MSVNKKVLYSAVVLCDKSHDKLIDFLLNYYSNIYADQDWEKIAHHMTISMGELPPELKPELGKTVSLKATHVGFTDNVIAVKVSGFQSKNKNPHITLAVNRKLGGKPVMSNNINNWQTLKLGALGGYLYGTITEVTT